MIMLDWRKKLFELYKYRGSNDHTEVWVFYDQVASSLDINQDRHYDKKQSAIREIFDRFLGRMERLDGFIESQVVKQRDFSPYLHYWTELLSGNGGEGAKEVTEKVLPQFWEFAQFYGYSSVKKFVNRYHSIQPDLLPKLASNKRTRDLPNMSSRLP